MKFYAHLMKLFKIPKTLTKFSKKTLTKKLSPVSGQNTKKIKKNIFFKILLQMSSFDHKEASDQVSLNSMHI